MRNCMNHDRHMTFDLSSKIHSKPSLHSSQTLKLFLVWDSEGIQESEDRVLEQIFESVDADSDDESSDDKKNKKRKHGKDGKKDKRKSSSDKSSDSSSSSDDKAHIFLIVALDLSGYI